MKILKHKGLGIYIPLLIVLIMYYYVDGVIIFALNMLYIIYIIIFKKHGKLISLKYITVSPLVAMVIIAVFCGIYNFGEFNARDILRDYYNYLQPILYIIVGYYLYFYMGKRYDIYRTVIVAAVILAFIYSIRVIQNPSIWTSSSIIDIRTEVGKETFINLISCALLITKKDIFEKRIQNICTFFLIFIFIIQFSRASYGTLIILMFVYLVLQKKDSFKIVKNTFIGLIAFSIMWYILPNNLTSDFVERIVKSLTEVSASSTVWNMDTIQSNWRGYENYTVSRIFEDANLLKKIVGFGFGKAAYLGGITINLGYSDYTSIAVFHNGYIQVLLKSGIVGIVLLLSFYLENIKRLYRASQIAILHYETQFMISLLCSCLFLTYVKGGIFRGSSLYELCILLGYIGAKCKNVTSNGYRLRKKVVD